MSEADPDLTLLKLLWIVKSGEVLIRMKGVDVLAVRRTGADPEIDVIDMESLEFLTPPITPLFLEKLRKMSRNLSAVQRNIRFLLNGRLVLNFGSRGTVLKDLEGFIGLTLKRGEELLRGRKSR